MDFTAAEKREAAVSLTGRWNIDQGRFGVFLPYNDAIGVQCQVNRLTREVEKARGLLDVFVWCAEKDKSAKWFMAVEQGREWLNRNEAK